MIACIALHLALALKVADAPAKSTNAWPAIKEVNQEYRLIDHEEESIDLPILDKQGKIIYTLECFLNAYEHATNDFDYSGAFECRLTSKWIDETYPPLLTDEENPTRDWQSRGRFLLEEITGKCADYPEFGRLRHFNLRGMKITIKINKLEMSKETTIWNTERIKSLKLSIKIENNPAAKSHIAKETPYAYPPFLHPDDNSDSRLDCSKILMRK